MWTVEVRQILDDNILLQNRELEALEAKVVAARDDEAKERLSGELSTKVGIRDLWEFQLLNALKMYTKMLPDEAETAKKLFGELAARAKEFVDQRYENFGRRYEAQLIYGQALASLGQPEQAPCICRNTCTCTRIT